MSVRERRQHCFLANGGCVGWVSRVWMCTAPLAACNCLCLWCHTCVVPLVPRAPAMLRESPVVSRIPSLCNRRACPLSEGSCRARGGEGGEAVCFARSCSSPPVCSQQRSQAGQAQVSQEGASCPPSQTGMPWINGLGDRRSLSTHSGGFICSCRERGMGKPVWHSSCRDKSQ